MNRLDYEAGSDKKIAACVGAGGNASLSRVGGVGLRLSGCTDSRYYVVIDVHMMVAKRQIRDGRQVSSGF
jgi:hypothetical protein